MPRMGPLVGLMLLLLLPSLSSGGSTRASLDAASAAFHANNIDAAVSHAIEAWRSGRACEGLRMALWMTHGEQVRGFRV